MNHEQESPTKFVQAIADAAEIFRYPTEAHYDMRDRWLRHGSIVARFAQNFGAPWEVQLGLYLHDIGKAGSSNKPQIWDLHGSQLNGNDFNEMKKHAQEGEDVLARFQRKTGIEIPEITLQIVKFHHEKKDGSGPYKLKGEEIPYWVRFATIVDQIFSRCEYRPYRDRLPFPLREAFDDVNKDRDRQYDGEILDRVRDVLEKELHWQLPLTKLALSFDVDGVIDDRGFSLQFDTLVKRLMSFLTGKRGSIIDDIPMQREISHKTTAPELGQLSLKDRINLWLHENRAIFPDALTEFAWLDLVRKQQLSGLEKLELLMTTGRSNQIDFRHMTEKKHALHGVLFDRHFFKPKGMGSAESKSQAIDQYLYENPDFFLIHYEDDSYTAFYLATLAQKYPGRVFVVLIERDPSFGKGFHYPERDLEKLDNLSVEPDLTAAFDTLALAGFKPYNKKDLHSFTHRE